MERLLGSTSVGEEGKCCAACMYPVPVEKMLFISAEERPLRHSAYPNNDAYLCNLCASTHAGNTIDYPDRYPDANVMLHQNFCTNAVLDQMGAFRDEAEQYSSGYYRAKWEDANAKILSLAESVDEWSDLAATQKKGCEELSQRLKASHKETQQWMDRCLDAEAKLTPAAE